MSGLQDGTVRVPIRDILIDRPSRQRSEIKTNDLELSIAKRGLLHPIIVGVDRRLHAGERRLTACKNLGHETILCRFVEDLGETELQMIELEENLKRSDLHWKDIVKASARITDLLDELYPDWTMTEKADYMALSAGTLSLYLRVWRDFNDPKVQQAGTVREAYNLLQRRDSRAAGSALEELLDVADEIEIITPPPVMVTVTAPEQTEEIVDPGTDEKRTVVTQVAKAVAIESPDNTILKASFLDWAPQYSGPKFNLIHCDFPYGVGVFDGEGQFNAGDNQTYSDKPEDFKNLLLCLCENLNRIMSLSGHLMFWYSGKWEDQVLVREILKEKAPSLELSLHQLIWVKSDNSGISAQVNRSPRHVYETCLLASRGKRQLVQIAADAYAAPTDKRIHPACKPEPMLRHFMRMLVDESTVFLDPTCGSGSAIRAAESLNARYVLGLEVNEDFVQASRKALKDARALRAASGRN